MSFRFAARGAFVAPRIARLVASAWIALFGRSCLPVAAAAVAVVGVEALVEALVEAACFGSGVVVLAAEQGARVVVAVAAEYGDGGGDAEPVYSDFGPDYAEPGSVGFG